LDREYVSVEAGQERGSWGGKLFSWGDEAGLSHSSEYGRKGRRKDSRGTRSLRGISRTVAIEEKRRSHKLVSIKTGTRTLAESHIGGINPDKKGISCSTIFFTGGGRTKSSLMTRHQPSSGKVRQKCP